MNRWVKVSFYGRVPSGQMLTGVDELEVAKTLCKSFGFDAIDGISVSQTPLRDTPPTQDRRTTPDVP